MPTLNIQTHCQAAEANRTSQSLPKTIAALMPGELGGGLSGYKQQIINETDGQ